MEIDKSTQGTLEEQMFYRRKTLKELIEIRHDNPIDEVICPNSYKIWYRTTLQYLQMYLTYFSVL